MATFIPEFSYWYFSEVCYELEQHPHVLPNDVSPIIRQLRYFLGPRYFALYGYDVPPGIPEMDMLWGHAQRWPYTDEREKTLNIIFLRERGYSVDARTYEGVVKYLWEPAKKLAKFLTGYQAEQFTDQLRGDKVERYSTWEKRGSEYLSGTTYLNLDPGRTVTNQIKAATLKKEPQTYKRLLTVEKTVTYEEEPRPIKTTRRHRRTAF